MKNIKSVARSVFYKNQLLGNSLLKFNWLIQKAIQIVCKQIFPYNRFKIMNSNKLHKYLYTLGMLLLFSCNKTEIDMYDELGPNGIGINQIISFTSISSLKAPADSFTLIQTTIKTNASLQDPERKVVFRTDHGLFSNGLDSFVTKINGSGNANAHVLSRDPGKANITAKISSYTIDTSIEFVDAFPNEIYVTLDKYTVDSTETITVNADLLRNEPRAKVSDPIRTSFKVTDNIGNPAIFDYNPTILSKNGKATNTIKNPFGKRGTYQIIVSTRTDTGDTLRRTQIFQVK